MILETKLHLYIHPAIQVLGIVFGYTALYWGGMRFITVHHKIKLEFPWRHHVIYGKIAIFLWVIGTAVGVYFTQAEWKNYQFTGDHYALGVIIFPFMLATFFSGYWMDIFKKRRKYLCLVHGTLGVLLCTLVFIQVITGIQVFMQFVWR
ncbi:DUF4079 family protein [Halodesulfovibrio marinisediminis]|uniref:Cytochrome b561 domain-containing protein n=1 Tax=Halodesulfovibrio marinisediminis DSM 17456 TaxID=1121457 RepID=A0A1N6I580_9BACT|nr:DUF4079 family protein [Halodesulfovibrio marinisediminis]SIO27075.1 Protein of unknown function [Halodesulfovibrio marinisediminis DSM 17456]